MVKYCDLGNGHFSPAKFGVSWPADSRSALQKRLCSVEPINTHYEVGVAFQNTLFLH